jgi:hypothetical protein
MAYNKGHFYSGDTLDGYKLVDCVVTGVDLTGGTIDESAITGGTIDGADITDGTISGTVGSISGTAYNVVSVDCTDDYALVTAQKIATVINISAAGTSKVLTLGMTNGQRVIISNAGTNSVTVKNLVADTGVTATTAKTAEFLITSGEIRKITADVDN